MTLEKEFKCVKSAADAVEAAATRLQITTSQKSLDHKAERAKDLAHDVREALEDIQEDQNSINTTVEEAKVSAAVKVVQGELEAVAAQLDDLSSTSHDPNRTGAPSFRTLKSLKSFKSTEQAIQELELLAKTKAKHSIQGRNIVIVLWVLWALALIVAIHYFNLFGSELFISGGVGLVWGLVMAGLYRMNRRWKHERSERLAMIPGAKGIQSLIHHLPSWISFSETEKMEWLNRVIAKAWPYYDTAISEEVKTQVTPLLDAYKPVFIKRIYFKKLNFGDAPFRVEGIRVDDKSKEEIVIEVDFRWSGDANIWLAIELPAGGSATRMVPKVQDLAISGTLRVIISPLLPEIPGFGAVTVSLMKPPIVKFHLDFGAAFGGTLSAAAVVSWLDPFLRNTVTDMVVWPKRIVVPLLSEEITGPLDDLYPRYKAALQIDVLSASGLPRMDTLGTSDPYVEFYTSANDVEKTSIKKNTLDPVWNERVWLLVQEPETQFAYITMNDVDMVNIRDLFRVNIFKGAANVIQSKSLMGRAMLKINDFLSSPGEPVNTVLPLGLGEFSDEDGCGGGRGELSIRVTYWPLEKMGGHASAPFGAFIVTLIRCNDLAAADFPLGTSDPYIKFTCNKETRKSSTIFGNLNPKWSHERFDWFKVPVGETLELVVNDYDRFSRDELLGTLRINIFKEVATAPGGDVTKTWALQDVPQEMWSMVSRLRGGGSTSQNQVKASTITMRLQWIPFH